jgi:glycosyltransferase involved in cell wall biosynthesis
MERDEKVRPNKIVIDARMSGTSSGRYVDKLIENLMLIDSTSEYVLLLRSNRLGAHSSIQSNFSIVECNTANFSFAEQIRLAVLLYRLKPDLVHFPFVQQPILYTGKVVTSMLDLTALRFRNPATNVIVSRVQQLAYWVVNMVAVRKSIHIIPSTEYVKDDIMKTLHYNHPGKFTVTLESADELPTPGEKVDELAHKKFIMYVGRHLPHKNLERLTVAHQALLASHPDLILAIVGKKDALTERMMAKYKDSKNIIFTGFVTDNQLRWLYEHTACYVFPSLSEGFGLPGLEAMKHGAPVASSNATCLPEVYGGACLYFDPYDVEYMAAKIDNVLSNPKVGDDLRAKGYKQAAKYSWKRMAEQTLAVYTAALSK